MEQTNPLSEKRENQRFTAKDGAFAVITSGLRLGPIIDISKAGFSFFYVPIDDNESSWDNAEIYFAQDDFHLQNLPIQLISDHSIDEDLPFNYVEKRRCSVTFRRLAPFQKIQLDYFITHYTRH